MMHHPEFAELTYKQKLKIIEIIRWSYTSGNSVHTDIAKNQKLNHSKNFSAKALFKIEMY